MATLSNDLYNQMYSQKKQYEYECLLMANTTPSHKIPIPMLNPDRIDNKLLLLLEEKGEGL